MDADDGSSNFHVCDEAYGRDLSWDDCHHALALFPRGSIPIPFNLAGEGTFGLPYQKHSGNCYITVESTASALAQHGGAWAIPNDLFALARDLVQECVENHVESLGGFHTYHFDDMVDWVFNFPITRSPNTLHHPAPREASFFTVTVSGPTDRKFSPGLHDPWVPQVLSATSTLGAYRHARHSAEFDRSAEYWSTQSERMTRGGTTPYWQPPNSANDDQMTYECDARLGSPAVADCAHIEWEQLHPSSGDSLTVAPGNPTFLHSNTCNLAISATQALTLTWEQIRAAAATLMISCVQHPVRTPKGGRAFFGGKVKGKRRRGVTGLNALPPHANITVFAQGKEGWKGEREEGRSCTWGKVVKGEDVAGCG